jgi:hypothetical protein
MKLRKHADIILNVISPVLGGCLIYYLGYAGYLPSLVQNYLPDGLWAYAFISAILIIWNRRVNLLWLIIVCLLAAGFEILQYLQLINGTPDIADAVVYLTCIGLGILINHFLQKKNLTKTV